MPQGGEVAIFVGQLESLNAQQRRQGVLDDSPGSVTPKARAALYVSPVQDLLPASPRTSQGQGTPSRPSPTWIKRTSVFVGLWAYNPRRCSVPCKDKALGQIAGPFGEPRPA